MNFIDFLKEQNNSSLHDKIDDEIRKRELEGFSGSIKRLGTSKTTGLYYVLYDGSIELDGEELGDSASYAEIFSIDKGIDYKSVKSLAKIDGDRGEDIASVIIKKVNNKVDDIVWKHI